MFCYYLCFFFNFISSFIDLSFSWFFWIMIFLLHLVCLQNCINGWSLLNWLEIGVKVHNPLLQMKILIPLASTVDLCWIDGKLVWKSIIHCFRWKFWFPWQGIISDWNKPKEFQVIAFFNINVPKVLLWSELALCKSKQSWLNKTLAVSLLGYSNERLLPLGGWIRSWSFFWIRSWAYL